MKYLKQTMNIVNSFSEKSRREGLLSLEEHIEELDGNILGIFKFGIKLVLGGVDPYLVDKILSNMIEREKDRKTILLKTIQKEAVLGIYAGDNSRILFLKLFSHLEEDECRVIESDMLTDGNDLNDIDYLIPKSEPVKNMGQSEFIKEAADIIRLSGKFADKARREGLLSLEDEIEDLDDEYFKQGLRLIVDGTDSDIVKYIYSNQIEREQNEYRKRIKKIIKEAVLNIQAGNNSMFIIHMLISYLDNSELNKIAKILLGMEFFKENVFEDANPLVNEKKKFPALAADIIRRAHSFSEKAERQGLLSLEDDIDLRKKSCRDIFEYGIQFVVDGIDPYYIGLILSNYIALEKNEEIKRLKNIQKEAVLGIIGNENPALLFHVLLSHIDDKELEEVKKYFNNAEFAEKLDELLDNPFFGEGAADVTKTQYAANLENSIGSKEVIDFFNKHYNFLEDVNQEILTDFIKSENPQTFASILAWISNDSFTAGGVETAAGILKRVDRSVRNRIINIWQEEDSELAEEVTRRLFSFDEIVALGDRDLQKVFREVDSFDLAKALKMASAEAQNKVFDNLSKRAGAMLREDMGYMGPIRKSDVKEAQGKIISIIMRFDAAGEIAVNWNTD